MVEETLREAHKNFSLVSENPYALVEIVLGDIVSLIREPGDTVGTRNSILLEREVNQTVEE